MKFFQYWFSLFPFHAVRLQISISSSHYQLIIHSHARMKVFILMKSLFGRFWYYVRFESYFFPCFPLRQFLRTYTYSVPITSSNTYFFRNPLYFNLFCLSNSHTFTPLDGHKNYYFPLTLPYMKYKFSLLWIFPPYIKCYLSSPPSSCSTMLGSILLSTSPSSSFDYSYYLPTHIDIKYFTYSLFFRAHSTRYFSFLIPLWIDYWWFVHWLSICRQLFWFISFWIRRFSLQTDGFLFDDIGWGQSPFIVFHYYLQYDTCIFFFSLMLFYFGFCCYFFVLFPNPFIYLLTFLSFFRSQLPTFYPVKNPVLIHYCPSERQRGIKDSKSFILILIQIFTKRPVCVVQFHELELS